MQYKLNATLHELLCMMNPTSNSIRGSPGRSANRPGARRWITKFLNFSAEPPSCRDCGAQLGKPANFKSRVHAIVCLGQIICTCKKVLRILFHSSMSHSSYLQLQQLTFQLNQWRYLNVHMSVLNGIVAQLATLEVASAMNPISLLDLQIWLRFLNSSPQLLGFMTHNSGTLHRHAQSM